MQKTHRKITFFKSLPYSAFRRVDDKNLNLFSKAIDKQDSRKICKLQQQVKKL